MATARFGHKSRLLEHTHHNGHPPLILIPITIVSPRRPTGCIPGRDNKPLAARTARRATTACTARAAPRWGQGRRPGRVLIIASAAAASIQWLFPPVVLIVDCHHPAPD